MGQTDPAASGSSGTPAARSVRMTRWGRRASEQERDEAPKTEAALSPGLLLLAVGVTLAVVAWGYLVYAAIDFGSAARGGEPRAWAFLGLAALGAVACLFVGLMLIARLLRKLGITSDHDRCRVVRTTLAVRAAHPPRALRALRRIPAHRPPAGPPSA